MAAPQTPDKAAQTVAAYLADWLDLQATQVELSTWHSYAGVVRRYLVPGLGEVVLAALSPAHLNPFYVRLLRRGASDGAALSLRTVQYCHDVLRKACADASRMGLLATNPCVDATVPRRHPDRPDGGRREMTVWAPAELRTFLDAAGDHPLRNLRVVAAGTGMRRGELLALAWPDVDVERRTLGRSSLKSPSWNRMSQAPASATPSARPRRTARREPVAGTNPAGR